MHEQAKFIGKRLLVHLGGRYKVRTFFDNMGGEIEIPIYQIPLDLSPKIGPVSMLD